MTVPPEHGRDFDPREAQTPLQAPELWRQLKSLASQTSDDNVQRFNEGLVSSPPNDFGLSLYHFTRPLYSPQQVTQSVYPHLETLLGQEVSKPTMELIYERALIIGRFGARPREPQKGRRHIHQIRVAIPSPQLLHRPQTDLPVSVRTMAVELHERTSNIRALRRVPPHLASYIELEVEEKAGPLSSVTLRYKLERSSQGALNITRHPKEPVIVHGPTIHYPDEYGRHKEQDWEHHRGRNRLPNIPAVSPPLLDFVRSQPVTELETWNTLVALHSDLVTWEDHLRRSNDGRNRLERMHHAGYEGFERNLFAQRGGNF